MIDKMDKKALLNVKEMCEYFGIGQTKARELLSDPKNNFTIKEFGGFYCKVLAITMHIFMSIKFQSYSPFYLFCKYFICFRQEFLNKNQEHSF